MTVPPDTAATLVLEEYQLTPLVLAVSVAVLPAARVSEEEEMPVGVPFLTVSTQLPTPPFSEAVTVVVPAALAVSTPFWSMTATEVFELFHSG